MKSKSIFVVLNLLVVQILASFDLPFTVDDCLADEPSTSSGEEPKDLIDCKSINPLLANCTCGGDYVDCSNKGFTILPSNLTQLPAKITRFLFDKNSIKSLSQLSLPSTAQLKVLSLKRNQIANIDSDFFDNLSSSLNFLFLCGNSNLTSFTQLKSNFASLIELELNNLNELTIQDDFFTPTRFPNLNRLDLNNASLKLGNKPFVLPSLTIMRLDGNGLEKLPCESFSSMPHLQSLNLTKNNLNKLARVSQTCLQNITSLRNLYLKANSLTEENLVWLDLSSKLEVLDISDNKLTRFPYSSLESAVSLKSLRVNVLNEFRFTGLANKNKVVWPQLSYLDLSNSNITILDDYAFTNFSNELNDLILKNCKIKSIKSDAFAYLNNLNHLDLSNNNLQTLNRPSDESRFNFYTLQGNLVLKNNLFRCNQLDVEWFVQFYSYKSFDRNLTCFLVNGTQVFIYDFLQSHRVLPEPPAKTTNILGIILLILIVLVVGTTVFYLIRRKQVQQRQQQYRYRFFTERQDDGFDTDNVPVYRDCTVSLRIKENDDANNSTNFNNSSNLDTSSTAALTEQRSDLIR